MTIALDYCCAFGDSVGRHDRVWRGCSTTEAVNKIFRRKRCLHLSACVCLSASYCAVATRLKVRSNGNSDGKTRTVQHRPLRTGTWLRGDKLASELRCDESNGAGAARGRVSCKTGGEAGTFLFSCLF